MRKHVAASSNISRAGFIGRVVLACVLSVRMSGCSDAVCVDDCDPKGGVWVMLDTPQYSVG